MNDEITIRRLRNAFRNSGVVFDEFTDHSGTLFRLSGDFHCDGVSIRLVHDKLILWVQDGFLTMPQGEGLSKIYDEFAKRWTNEHQGFSTHFLNPFHEEGAAPACKATYKIPSTSMDLKTLLRVKMLGKDLETARDFFHEIRELSRRLR